VASTLRWVCADTLDLLLGSFKVGLTSATFLRLPDLNLLSPSSGGGSVVVVVVVVPLTNPTSILGISTRRLSDEVEILEISSDTFGILSI